MTKLVHLAEACCCKWYETGHAFGYVQLDDDLETVQDPAVFYRLRVE